jgi:hypothetical protein
MIMLRERHDVAIALTPEQENALLRATGNGLCLPHGNRAGPEYDDA